MQLGREDLSLLPLEGLGCRVVGGDEGVDGVAQLPGRGEAGPLQGASAEDAEPNLDLIQPAGVGGGVVEVHVGMTGPPPVALGLVGVEVVQDHVNGLLRRILADQFVHEVEELSAPASCRVPGLDAARGDFEGGEQGRGAVALVAMAGAAHRLAIGQAQVPLGSFQRLDGRLFVDAQHHGLLRRVEVQPHDIGGLGRKLRVRAHLMGPSPLQMDAMLTQHPPHVMVRHVSQGLGHQRPGPGGVAGRRRLGHHVEDALLGLLVIPPRRPWPRRVLQPVQAVRGKARSPLAHRGVADPQPPGDRHRRLTGRRGQDDARPQGEPLFRGPRSRPLLQRGAILFRQRNLGRWSCHAPKIGYDDDSYK